MHHHFLLRLFATILLLPVAAIQAGEPLPLLTEGLAVEAGRKAGRSPVYIDPVEHAWITATWAAPAEGDELTRPDGRVAQWERVTIADDGTINSPALRNGYVYLNIPSASRRIVMLEASGHSAVRVNGDSRAGDPYNYGFVKLPILLQPGDNELLFRCARGRLKVALSEPPAQVFFLGADDTRPHLLDSSKSPGPAGVVVVNATTDWVDVRVVAKQKGIRLHNDAFVRTASTRLAPLTLQKLPIQLPPPVIVDGGEVHYEFRLDTEGLENGGSRTLVVPVKQSTERHDVTFISRIDGSAQYYTFVPPTKPLENPALVLTLHGASVEGRRQAASYTPKDWCAIVAPTNRRPYGFDWEDWGRLDAIDVLERATESFEPDPSRIYLTGHSMGGHGTWNIGVNFPDRFAAIGPSAGWVSFWSYTGAAEFNKDKPIEQIMRRAVSSSDTLSLVENLNHGGIYILHGDADDNVPVTQARTMRTELAKFHRDFAYFEQPGAGHWWGNQCVDWKPMFEFFKDRTIPTNPAKFSFVTNDPGITSRCYWIEVLQQVQWGVQSRMEVDATNDSIDITTANMQSFAIDLDWAADDSGLISRTIKIDDSTTVVSRQVGRGLVYLQRSDDGLWSQALPDAASKNPNRSGPFKNAFRNNMAFVVGNDAWSLAKARYDAETFWYRGNGSVNIIPAATLGATDIRNRNIIVYGGEAFQTVTAILDRSKEHAVSIDGGAYTIGGAVTRRDSGMAILAIMPGLTDDTLIGVVAGVDESGQRLCEQVPVFVSGIGYPDWTLLSTDMLRNGFEGIIGAGFFDANWDYSPDQSAWQDGLSP